MARSSTKKYVAFLRGINVGGNNKVKMDELKKTLGKLGLQNVATLIASGNVSFDAAEQDEAMLAGTIEKALEKKFGFAIPTVLRSSDEIAALVKADPFKGIAVTPATRLYVTFLKEEPASKPAVKIPYASASGEFRIIAAAPREIFSVLQLTDSRTVDLMGMIEKEWGKKVTTRNWNTVVKMAQK